MARALIASLAALALLAPAASAQTSLQRTLTASMSAAGSHSGAYVIDAATGDKLFAWRPDTRRTLASNTKLFTSAAALGRLGQGSTLATALLGSGRLGANGTWSGSLYLRGGGDPTFGTRAFSQNGYGSSANVEALAANLAAAGFKRVTGRVLGDESLFDALRGGPDSGYRTSIYVGPLSALDFNHGYGSGHFLASPALYAAQQLRAALKARGIGVSGSAGTAVAPAGSVELTEVRSPSVARMLRLQNKPSDNFFAEMLAKGLAVDGRPGSPLRSASAPLPATPTPSAPGTAKAVPPQPGVATTASGARTAAAFARTLGATPKLVDGSGLAHSDQASPRSVATLLDRIRARRYFRSLYDSLPVAGRDGTLDTRMRSGPAHGRCHAKTGSLTGVSALSGYCTTLGHRTLVFSILMNGVSVPAARRLQDRMAQALAGWRG